MIFLSIPGQLWEEITAAQSRRMEYWTSSSKEKDSTDNNGTTEAHTSGIGMYTAPDSYLMSEASRDEEKGSEI
jgi:hypothetical protein